MLPIQKEILLKYRNGKKLKEGKMSLLIKKPAVIKAKGNKEKIIREYVGRVNSRTDVLSIARMDSPPGWKEPGQIPQFDEYTLILKGTLRVETRGKTIDVRAGQAIITRKNEWVRYSTPFDEGAEYIAVCLPAFSPETVNRDE
jgi:mannose-6-phosphate isomerase-like protein (cupin superfamily)